jgi:hypothetical protein
MYVQWSRRPIRFVKLLCDTLPLKLVCHFQLHTKIWAEIFVFILSNYANFDEFRRMIFYATIFCLLYF